MICRNMRSVWTFRIVLHHYRTVAKHMHGPYRPADQVNKYVQYTYTHSTYTCMHMQTYRTTYVRKHALKLAQSLLTYRSSIAVVVCTAHWQSHHCSTGTSRAYWLPFANAAPREWNLRLQLLLLLRCCGLLGTDRKNSHGKCVNTSGTHMITNIGRICIVIYTYDVWSLCEAVLLLHHHPLRCIVARHHDHPHRMCVRPVRSCRLRTIMVFGAIVSVCVFSVGASLRPSNECDPCSCHVGIICSAYEDIRLAIVGPILLSIMVIGNNSWAVVISHQHTCNYTIEYSLNH